MEKEEKKAKGDVTEELYPEGGQGMISDQIHGGRIPEKHTCSCHLSHRRQPDS